MALKELTPRMQLLLDHCKVPKSIGDLSEELEVGYYTVRKEVKNLQDHGFITELPFRREKEILYQVTWNDPNASEPRLVFTFMNSQVSARTIIQRFSAENSNVTIAGKTVARVLSYLLVNSQHRLEMNGEGSYPGEKLSREVMIRARNYFKACTELCDQLLAAPIWTEKPGEALTMLGEVPVDDDHANSVELIDYVQREVKQ